MSKRQLTIDDIELCQTEDQSWTVLHKELDAHYRSTHGAESESEWVFIKGTRLIQQKSGTSPNLGLVSAPTPLYSVKSEIHWPPPPLHYIDRSPTHPECLTFGTHGNPSIETGCRVARPKKTERV